jgi:hypothetical protein
MPAATAAVTACLPMPGSRCSSPSVAMLPIIPERFGFDLEAAANYRRRPARLWPSRAGVSSSIPGLASSGGDNPQPVEAHVDARVPAGRQAHIHGRVEPELAVCRDHDGVPLVRPGLGELPQDV